MTWIIVLALIGLVLYFVELVFLPGITVAALGALAALIGAVAWTFVDHGTEAGFWMLGGSLLLVLIMTVLFFRRRTWRRVSLNTEISESIAPKIDTMVALGDRGKAITRLSPMGNVVIDGRTIEAKTISGYIDPGATIEVVGFDNQNVVVKSV